jgi:hypothetical protein
MEKTTDRSGSGVSVSIDAELDADMVLVEFFDALDWTLKSEVWISVSTEGRLDMDLVVMKPVGAVESALGSNLLISLEEAKLARTIELPAVGRETSSVLDDSLGSKNDRVEAGG